MTQTIEKVMGELLTAMATDWRKSSVRPYGWERCPHCGHSFAVWKIARHTPELPIQYGRVFCARCRQEIKQQAVK